MTQSTSESASLGSGCCPDSAQMQHAHATFVEAEATINGPRRGSYGDVGSSFGKIADMWTVILNRTITSKEVALCMIAFKLCREANAHKHDNIVDIMGYTGLLAELHGGAK